MSQERFCWRKRDFFYNIFGILLWKRKCWKNRRVNRNYVQYLNGTKKYEKDVDITTILSTIRKVDWLYNLLLDDRMKELEKLGRHYLICEDEHANIVDERNLNDATPLIEETPTLQRGFNCIQWYTNINVKPKNYRKKINELVNYIPYLNFPDAKEQILKLMLPENQQKENFFVAYREAPDIYDWERARKHKRSDPKRLDTVHEDKRMNVYAIDEEDSKDESIIDRNSGRDSSTDNHSQNPRKQFSK